MAVRTVALAVLTSAVLIPTFSDSRFAFGDAPEETPLTKNQARAMRRTVIESGIRTTRRIDGGFTVRVLVLDNDAIGIHKANRVATLKLLLDMVKSARPDHARAAGAIAIALEDEPEMAALWGDGDLDLFDTSNTRGLPTEREILTKELESALIKASN